MLSIMLYLNKIAWNLRVKKCNYSRKIFFALKAIKKEEMSLIEKKNTSSMERFCILGVKNIWTHAIIACDVQR